MKNPYNRIVNEIYKTFFPLLNKSLIDAIRDFYVNNYYIDKTIIEKRFKVFLKKTKNIDYYKDVQASLDSYPVMTKEDYRKIGEKKLTNKFISLLPKYKMNTGGSTGEPYEFYCDFSVGLIDFYHQKFQFEKMNFSKNDKLYVLNGWFPEDELVSNRVFWRAKKNINEFPFGSKEFSTHYLNSDNAGIYIDELVSRPPQYFRSYPSVFVELTKYLITYGYKSPPFKLKGIQLTSEMTSKQQEDLLKKYWGDIIFFQYGHSEAATIASKYPGEEYYTFSPYYGLVEILDEKNDPVKPGEVGRVVVTSIHNKVRPFIRYDTGDLATFRDYNNGVVTVYDIVGRVQDVVEDKEGNIVSITGLVFGQHFHAFKNIISWQINNEKKGVLYVDIIKEKSFTNDDDEEIIEKLSFKGRFKVYIRYVDKITKTRAGKHKLVIR